MGLRDILRKKDTIEDSHDNRREDAVNRLQAPEFTFIRSDTHTQEVIHPPRGPDSLYDVPHEDLNHLSVSAAADAPPPTTTAAANKASSRPRRLSEAFRSNRSSRGSSPNGSITPDRPSPGRRLSQRLHLSRGPPSSENVPADLPEIVTTTADGETQWEKRATLLARTAGENEALHRSAPCSPLSPSGSSAAGAGPLSPALSLQDGLAGLRIVADGAGAGAAGRGADPPAGVASTPAIDANIQEAIRLHEEGDLDQSTRLFGVLADPGGANNPLSQVLYGLALRHGWGCQPEPEKAVFYLSAAAKNAADVETLALQAGLKKGGAAKGELVLAIFELANCFRHGWGIEKDALAAKQYYETAANLGDTDAMNEVAWCYLEGFGCKKDKYAAAKYYRLAETNGNKTLGNSWIWKEKYDPGNGKKGKK